MLKKSLLVLFLVSFLSLNLQAQLLDTKTGNKPNLTQDQKVLLDQNTPYVNPKHLPIEGVKGLVQWSEGFEGVTFPPTGWAVHALDGGLYTWERYASTPIFGTASAAVRWESSSLANNDWLVTPQFLVHGGDEFKFWGKGSTSFFDSVQIYVSTTGGVPPTGYTYIGSCRPMAAALFTFGLSAYTGQNVYVAFRYAALDELRLYIDSVYVETPVDKDVAPIALNVPGELPVGPFTPIGTVKNLGALVQTFNVTLTINPGGYTHTQTVTALAPGATQDLTFNSWTAAMGSFTAKLFTQLSGDMVPANDTLTKNVAIANAIYTNGPFVSHPGGGPGGSDGSVLGAGMNILGFGAASINNYRMADDFVVPPSARWQVDLIDCFGYQTGSTTTSTFTLMNYKIWNGQPGQPGSVVVAGDAAGTLNQMTSSTFSNAYRYSTTLVDQTRPIMKNTASGGFTLDPGTYWIDYTFAGTLASGPWAPPITIPGQPLTGNAIQWQITTWAPANDSGGTSPVSQQGLPFVFKGVLLPIPVELTSFLATADRDVVSLIWSTATETNNKGFSVERKSGDGNFTEIGFVNGNGTVTTEQNYAYSDKGLAAGNYTYRLRQVDFDGTFEYSNAIEVAVDVPTEFALEQNYPNPFNPSTNIDFALKTDSKVVVSIFNTLGEEVANVVNGDLKAGTYKVNFNATNLTSGIYFYRIDASGVDGSKFSSVKKMMLMK
ncbi:MAG: choice-of-anchor J domain-containing protein [Ignavibacteriaceae bacterium]